MINELQAAKSGYFYKIHKPITTRAITELFRIIRAAQTAPSNNHFSCFRQALGNAHWSAICFMFDRKPAFLDDSTGMVERVSGYLLIVEYENHLAVFKSQLDLPTGFVADHLKRIDPEMIDVSVMEKDSVFERLRLRNMTISKFALRSKTLEAENLENAVGLASSSRFAPLGYSVRTNGECYSATPRTGRISQRSDRAGYQALVSYACHVIDRMKPSSSAVPAFLNAFARPLELSSVNAKPTLLAIDVAGLQDVLFDEGGIRLVRHENGKWAALTKPQVDVVLRALGTAFPLEGTGSRMNVVDVPGGAKVGAISVNKSRIALRSLIVPAVDGIHVERSTQAIGADEQRIALREFIDQSDSFLVLFDVPQLAYIEGTLYRDDAMTNGGEPFLKYLFDESELSGVSDEKGTFASGQTAFDSASTFAVLISTASKDDDLLVCDDLGDEWADFIGLRTDPQSPRVTFYHAKHGDLSLGASPFHISVSQAIKNLGRLGMQESDMRVKYKKWRETYSNDKVTTDISRVCRGKAATLEVDFDACRSAPHVMKRVAIVTSSLSRAAVETKLKAIQNGARPDPYFVQLYWLLSSFFSACAEVGAFGCVICRP